MTDRDAFVLIYQRPPTYDGTLAELLAEDDDDEVVPPNTHEPVDDTGPLAVD